MHCEFKSRVSFLQAVDWQHRRSCRDLSQCSWQACSWSPLPLLLVYPADPVLPHPLLFSYAWMTSRSSSFVLLHMISMRTSSSVPRPWVKNSNSVGRASTANANNPSVSSSIIQLFIVTLNPNLTQVSMSVVYAVSRFIWRCFTSWRVTTISNWISTLYRV